MVTPSQGAEDYTLRLDTRVYSLDAIKKTAYKLANKATILLEVPEPNVVHVIFKNHLAASFLSTEAAFLTELVDQDLREIIRRETEPLRNAILAHAFSKTILIGGQ